MSAVTKISELSLARTWYLRCRLEHDDCEQGRDEAFYPMRLIDVRGPSPRLVLSEDLKEGLSESYATLSHRWSNFDDRFSLTRDNMSQYQTGISEEDISPTLRDAILVCQALEVPYLWVDSMCIIQSGEGSLEDWQENGLAMSSIYANSLVNIAAETLDPELGFIQHYTLADLRTPTRFKMSESEFVILPVCIGNHIARPLERRGWIVQEMLLAPRILRFGIGQMSWECTQNPLACESFISPHGRDQNRLRELRREILRLQLVPSILERNDADQSTFKLQELWLDVVEAYSNCDLTFAEKDKFMAMSGIASRVGELMQSEYIAGSFRNMLPRELLWKVEKQGSFKKDAVHRWAVPAGTSNYRAPTWSWASLDKAIDFTQYIFHAKYPLLTEVLDAIVVRTHEENPYGPIQQADLIVRGNITRLQWSPEKLDIILDAEKYKHSCWLDEDTTPQSSQLLFLEIQHASIYSSSPGADVYGVLLEEIDRDDDNVPRARRLGLMKIELPESEMKQELITLRLV
ncbi:HET-domain-containing protein [Cadophora sp. DSE1049]|nr:HET-domain-containing protein [Cadophora sp. DSE1049]